MQDNAQNVQKHVCSNTSKYDSENKLGNRSIANKTDSIARKKAIIATLQYVALEFSWVTENSSCISFNY